MFSCSILKRRPGKVASLLEMVTKARMKLKKQGSGGASDTDTDNEASKQSVVKPVPAAAPAAHPAHIMSALHAGPGSHAPGAHVHHKVHPPNHPDPSRLAVSANAGTTAAAPSAIDGLNYKVSTDAELDAFVPAIQPPSVPQLLPMMSFRKAQSNIPLPPLSKDNLTILLKGKDPDSFVAGAAASGTFAANKGIASKKISKKSSKKNNTEAAASVTVSKKAGLPKEAMMASEKKANVSKFIAAQNKAQGRYATIESDEEDEPQTLSPEQQYQQRLLRENLRQSQGQSQVRFAPDVDESEAGSANGSDSDDHEDGLQAEYSRLREEFNAKLQQAAAFNQMRNSAKYATGDLAVASGMEHDGVQDDGGYDYADHADGVGDEGDGEGHTGEEIASGNVTRSYSEGMPKVSTQELLRMWEIEDAEEEARKQAERGHGAQVTQGGVARSGSNQLSPDRERDIGYEDADIEAHEQEHEQDSDSEEEYMRNRRTQEATKKSVNKPAAANIAIPTIPTSVVSVDDPSLDAECLSFLNKMSMKIPTK